MPEPNTDESHDDFISRCIPVVIEDGTAKDPDQAVAVCNGIWDKSQETKSVKAGARHNKADQKALQDIHDASIVLGAACPEPKAEITTFPPLGNFDNALKAISETPDELRVGNYLVLWGDENHRDLEGLGSKRVNDDGSRGEFFTPQTVFDSTYTKSSSVLVDWEHGLDPDEMGIDEDELLGYVDLKTIHKDEKGLFGERVLNRRHKYLQYLEELIKAGLIGSSTMSTNKGVQRKSNGEITKFPLKRDTLTVQPMEPRMLTQNVVAALKALKVTPPELPGVLQEPTQTADAEGAGNAPQTPEGEAENPQSKKTMENANMELTQEQLDTMVAAAGKAGAEAAIKSLPTINSAGVVVTRDEADTPFASMGAQLSAVIEATLSQGRTLAPRLKALTMGKALGANELVGSEGGFLLEPTFVSGLLTPLHDTGPFSSRAAKLAIGPNSNGITVRAVDEISRAAGSRWGGILGYRLAEAGTKLATTPTFRLIELRLKKYAVLMYATEELLQDTTALGGVAAQGAAEELDFMINDDICNGGGVGGPLGILNSGALVTVTKEGGQLAATVVTANIYKMWARMHPRSKGNAVWFINTDVTPQLFALNQTVGTGGMPMFMAPGSLPQSPAGALLGRPIVETEFNPSIGDAGCILLADMSQYVMIDKDVQAASSIHVQFLTDQSCFRWVYRCDGQPKIAAPLTPYKGTGSTLSPFVALGTV